MSCFVRTKKDPPPGTRRRNGEFPWHIAKGQKRSRDGKRLFTTSRCGRLFSEYELRGDLIETTPGVYVDFAPKLLCKRCQATES